MLLHSICLLYKILLLHLCNSSKTFLLSGFFPQVIYFSVLRLRTSVTWFLDVEDLNVKRRDISDAVWHPNTLKLPAKSSLAFFLSSRLWDLHPLPKLRTVWYFSIIVFFYFIYVSHYSETSFFPLVITSNKYSIVLAHDVPSEYSNIIIQPCFSNFKIYFFILYNHTPVYNVFWSYSLSQPTSQVFPETPTWSLLYSLFFWPIKFS